jgi:hypothetical protein
VFGLGGRIWGYWWHLMSVSRQAEVLGMEPMCSKAWESTGWVEGLDVVIETGGWQERGKYQKYCLKEWS